MLNRQKVLLKIMPLIFAVAIISQPAYAQADFSMESGQGDTDGKKKKALFIKDDPDDTSRWAKLRDIFQKAEKGKRDSFAQIDDSGYDAEEGENDKKLLKLSGILSDKEGRSSALLNGYIVKRGDSYDGYKVKKVGKNSVTLRKNGKEHVLYVQQ
jgi:type II secretory pathway component PulC